MNGINKSPINIKSQTSQTTVLHQTVNNTITAKISTQWCDMPSHTSLHRMQHRKPIALAPHWSSFLSGKVVSAADSIHRRCGALNCEFYSHWRANASHIDFLPPQNVEMYEIACRTTAWIFYRLLYC